MHPFSSTPHHFCTSPSGESEGAGGRDPAVHGHRKQYLHSRPHGQIRARGELLFPSLGSGWVTHIPGMGSGAGGSSSAPPSPPISAPPRPLPHTTPSFRNRNHNFIFIGCPISRTALAITPAAIPARTTQAYPMCMNTLDACLMWCPILEAEVAAGTEVQLLQ